MIINYSDQEVIKNKKSIFIAGPTPRDGNVKSWRTIACEKLNELGLMALFMFQNIQHGNQKQIMLIRQCGKERH